MQKEILYQLLLDQENELRRRIKKIQEDINRRHISKKTSQQNIEQSNDDVLGKLKEDAVTKLELTRFATMRLENGSFGNCLECGSEIASERLEVLPHTQLCRYCARRREGDAGRRAHSFLH